MILRAQPFSWVLQSATEWQLRSLAPLATTAHLATSRYFSTIKRLGTNEVSTAVHKRKGSKSNAPVLGDTSADLTGFPSRRGPANMRQDFYHRRHKYVKVARREQARLRFLEKEAADAKLRGTGHEAERATNALRVASLPWLQRNLPVPPPQGASVAALRTAADPRELKPTVPKEAYYREKVAVKEGELHPLEVVNLKVGFARDAQYALPKEVRAFMLDQTTFCVYGVDKNQVTQVASNIRRIRPPEPYKGAGIRIVGETIRRVTRRNK